MRSLLHNTCNHQNDPGRSTTVPVDGNSSMVNMDFRESRKAMLDIIRMCPDKLFL